ncbi:MAG: PorP/SprF family type IX secretion system membrane protein [Crocinitomicaceae bacterium]|nr:PorP/SprF family type IX secretion system membrane protein [Crocinitomicaceae bacterium]
MKTLTLFFVLLAGISFAQRDVSSQMFWNNYSNFNPAMSGLEYKMHGSFLYRNQWPALTGSQQSVLANFNMRLKDKHGVGINFSNEQNIAWKKNSISVNYNYQLKLNEASKLSIGVAASYFNSRVDWAKVTLGDNIGGANDFTDINANLGVAYTWKNLLVHGSVANVFNSVLSPNDVTNTYYGNRTFHLGAAYNVRLGKRFALKPQLLAQYTDGFTRLSLNAQFSFDNKYWIGTSFSQRENLGFMAGWNIHKKFRIAYSYDRTISKLNNGISGGSHEFSLGYYLK